MKFWSNLNKWQKRGALVVASGSTIVALLLGISKGANYIDEKITTHRERTVQRIEHLEDENIFKDKIIESLHYDVLDLNERMEMVWHQAMSNMYPFDDNRYYMIFSNGDRLEVYIRSDHVEPTPEQWVFYEVSSSVMNHQYMYRALWSGVYKRFYFIDGKGDEYHLYKY